MAKSVVVLFWLSLVLAAAQARATDNPQRWYAGPYSYSDELGGFTIRSISGTGVVDDPVVLTQEFHSASPVTLFIRAERPTRPRNFVGDFANGFIYMRIVAINNSGLPWIGFEFELQEIRDLPSAFGDGLSFDQARLEPGYVGSDRYSEFSRDFEPFDRLLFRNGSTDSLQTVTFDFLITDFTPRWEFFLVQDPMVPLS